MNKSIRFVIANIIFFPLFLPASETIPDENNNLIWQANDAPTLYTHREATQYCEQLSLNGIADWVLPSIEDWLGEDWQGSILDKAYLNLGDNCYWTSHFWDFSDDPAYIKNGSCNDGTLNRESPLLVRCVSKTAGTVGQTSTTEFSLFGTNALFEAIENQYNVSA